MARRAKAEAKEQIVGTYSNDGCVLASGNIGVAGKLRGVDPDKYTFSRILFYSEYDDRVQGLRWATIDYEGWNIVSMCLFADRPFLQQDGWNGARAAVLSAKGEVELGARGVPDIREKLPDVLGSVTQIRQIGDRLYVCGMQGQVFRRDENGWVHIDQGIRDPRISAKALHLSSIDGTSDRDIYVCGFGGRILQYDGVRWHEYSSPTNLHLERVHCVSPKEVYVCGNEGTFFRLVNGGFQDFSIRTDEHFWGMTSFQGKIYLATLTRLYEFDGSSARIVNTGLEPPVGGYRLDARDGQLWSFGVDDLAWFDGKTWNRLEDPDNKIARSKP